MKQSENHIDSVNDPSGWLQLVLNQVSSLRFGQVQITVHESRVVQIEKTEKFKLHQNPQLPTRKLEA